MILPATMLAEYNTLEAIRDLTPRHFRNRRMEKSEFLRIATLCNAYWLYPGDPDNPDPRYPHAELTTGRCSNGFISCREIFSYSNLAEVMAAELEKVIAKGNSRPPDWVVGSAYSSIDLAVHLARLMNARHGWCEKEGEKQVWRPKVIGPEEDVLQIEELMTTGSTIEAVQTGLKEGNPHSVRLRSTVPVLVHRSTVHYVNKRRIEAVFSFPEMWDVEPSKCPLCQIGSERIKPKASAENWQRLTQPV